MIIAKEYDYMDRLVFDESYADGQLMKNVSNKKLQELYTKRETPLVFTSIEEGIKKTIQWFNENKYKQ